MANRKKRLKNGIESIKEQIKEHELKRENALKEGEIELAGYYTDEITGLKKSEKNNEDKLEKS